MLLALVLTMAVLPAAGTLAYIARSDLAAALDDYHRTKATYAAEGAIALIEADLKAGGDGQITWPDEEVNLSIIITDSPDSCEAVITVHCSSAVRQYSIEVIKPEPEDTEDSNEIIEVDSLKQ